MAARRFFTGKQKSALLLMMLGVDEASHVTQHMNQLDVRDLARVTSELKNVTKEELNEVAREFLEMLTSGDVVLPFDADFSSEMLKRAIGADHFFSLSFLQQADKKQLIELTRNEHPQVIAFILSYVPSDKAGTILATLPPEQQADIAYRISTMEPPAPFALRHLDRMVGDKLNMLDTSDSMEVGGVESLVKIMRGVGRNAERTILDKLEGSYPELSEEIKSRMFVFEDIVLLDNRSIQKVLKDINMSTLALALKKSSPEIGELIMNNLSDRAKAVLQEDIASMGKVPLRDVEAAQQEIVETIRRMEEANEINIRKEEEIYV